MWKDNWIPKSTDYKLRPLIPSDVHENARVCQLIDRITRAWKVDVVGGVTGEEGKKMIQEIPLYSRETEDSII